MPAVKQAQLPDAPSSKKRNGEPRRNGHAPNKKPGVFTRLWRTIKAVYYASAPNWQVLKSGALFFFGLFCWSSANLLLSYQPDWTWTYVLMAYGFLLTGWGPLTHLVLVPHVIPWLRRFQRGSVEHWIGKQLTPINLTIFTAAVLLLSLFPPEVMTFDFRSITQSTRTADVNPSLDCTREAATISCHLTDAEGVGAIVVQSGGHTVLERTTAPFTFSLDEGNLVDVVGQRQFEVVVQTPDGSTARRFTRTASMIQ